MNPEVFNADAVVGANGVRLPLAGLPSPAQPPDRRLSLSEARRIALDVLQQAEEERRELARQEAAHETVWEETA
jgi:hypothetical protein